MFAGVLYLALMTFVFFQGVKAIRKVESEKKLRVGGIVSAWLAFQAQSIISIDNIGISIWGWILSGIIIGLATEVDSKEIHVNNGDKKQIRDLKKIRLMQPAISGLATLLAILIIVPLYRAESNMYQERMRFDPTNPANTGPLLEYANKIFDGKLVDPSYKLTSVTYLFSVAANNEAVAELEKLVSSDPRNQDAYILLARYYEATSDFQKANEYREIVSKLDPWNSENYLKMGRNFKLLGNTSGMTESLEKILVFDKNSIESKAAQQEFIS
jgi:tetratricopeptide (TPR) repeat protein